MNLHTQNSTALLFEKLNSLRHAHESWRAVHLKLSRMPERHNRTLLANFIVKSIRDELSELDGYIYLCEDSDIIILFQGRAQPILNKLSHHFADIKPQYGAMASAVISVYDLARDWAFFYMLAYRKSLDADTWKATPFLKPSGGLQTLFENA